MSINPSICRLSRTIRALASIADFSVDGKAVLNSIRFPANKSMLKTAQGLVRIDRPFQNRALMVHYIKSFDSTRQTTASESQNVSFCCQKMMNTHSLR